MLVKSQGIIIKTTRYSESSLIAKIFTRSHGMLSFYIQGVFLKKSSFKPSYFFPLTLVELDFYFRENKNLLKIKEIKPVEYRFNAEWETSKTPLFLIFSELINKCVKEVEKNEKMFIFFKEIISLLNEDKQQNDSNMFIFFMVNFSNYLGFSMQNNFSDLNCFFDLKSGNFVHESLQSSFCLSFEESKFLSVILNANLSEYNSIFIPFQLRLNLIEHLIFYYKIHIEGFTGLKSFEIFRKVFLNS